MAKDVEEQVDILVFRAPPGETGGGRCGVVSEPDEAEMAFELPSREWVMGDTIEGRLLVCPLKELSVTEVRVELVRVEQVWNTRTPLDALASLPSVGVSVGVHIGSDPNVNEAQETEKVRLSEGTTLQPGQELASSFRLAIPSPAARSPGC